MKIEIDQATWTRVQEFARAAGYSSPEEFVRHAIERHLAQSESPQEEKKSAAGMRGIGYLDAGLDI